MCANGNVFKTAVADSDPIGDRGVEVLMNLRKLSVLQSLFVSGLVVSNIIATKVVVIWKLMVPAAVIVYPVTFLLTDTIGELYGKEEANRTVWYGFIGSLFAMIVIYAGMLLPAAPFMEKQQSAYELLMGPNRRIVFASLLAYICSQKHDVWAFHLWKKLTAGRYKWLRNNLSTMTSQLIDTVVFIGIAFVGVVPDLGKMILAQYAIKLLIALVDTPFFYVLTRSHLETTADVRA
jgi:uncharacterized integral membrane protein (TIGR00697 family)